MGIGGAMNKTALIGLVTVVVVVAGIIIFWLSHTPPPPPDCAFTGWKRTVGVDLDAQVQDLNAVKGKLGISDEMIHDYDTLMKDYALKYDSACRDFQAGRMSLGEYTCFRQNMTSTLNDIRTFTQAVEAAKSLSDPSGQKAIVQKAYAALEQASRANYRSGCTSAMTVNPKQIAFTGDTLDSYVEVTNGGNNDFTFSVEGLPAAFRPHPPSGKLPVSGTAAIVIERSFGPVPPTQPIKFLVRTNLNDEQEIAITVARENMDVWKRLGKKLQNNVSTVRTTVEDALQVINTSASQRVPTPDKYLMASTLLLSIGQVDTAHAALQAADYKDSSLGYLPSTLFLKGVIANREQQPEAALTYFAEVKKNIGSMHTASYEDDWAPLSDLASGIINFNLGKRGTADTILKTRDLQREVWENPLLLDDFEHEFCEKGDCRAYLHHTFQTKLNPPKGG